jgi:2-dehydropantoate 2-reductase
MENDVMRVLVIGAGALGGYFGAGMARAGRDVTFLVRPRRAEQLAQGGLCVVSPHGDFSVPAVTVQADDLRGVYDLILVGTKSYSLPEAMDQFAPAVGPATAILPILNGMAHLDILSARFGTEKVLGGKAVISASLDDDGRVVMHAPVHVLSFGELHGGFSDRTRALSNLFDGCGFEAPASANILQDMWDKWAQLAAGAGMNCLMRGTLGDILSVPGGQEAILSLYAETRAVAAAAGFPSTPAYVDFTTKMYTMAGSPLKASMLRDIERGGATEGEHALGDLVSRGRTLGVATPLLDLARIHLATYEAARAREAAAG